MLRASSLADSLVHITAIIATLKYADYRNLCDGPLISFLVIQYYTMKNNVKKIVSILKKLYGGIEFVKQSPYHVLVGAIISQRTMDQTTDRVSADLLRKAGNPKKMVSIGKSGISKIIRSANYYRTKSKRIYEMSKMILDDYNGRVPKTREELMKLPGVGGKTADIVMLVARDASVIPVDTHVAVVSRRLGWTKENTPEKIRNDLHSMFKKNQRRNINILLVEFGKETCTKHMPKCFRCPIRKLCPYPSKTLQK